MGRAKLKSNGRIDYQEQNGRLKLTWIPSGTESPRPKKIVGWLLFLAIFPGIAAGLLAIGSGSSTVSCVRTSEKKVNCEIREGFVFNLFHKTRHATDVQKARIATSESDEGTLLSSAVLHTPTGPVPLISGASNTGNSSKRAAIREIRAFLKQEDTSEFRTSLSKWNIFGFLGMGWMVFSILLTEYALLSWLFPVCMELDLVRRRMRYRSSPFQLFTRALSFSEIRGFGFQEKAILNALRMETIGGQSIVFGKWMGLPKFECDDAIAEISRQVGTSVLSESSPPPAPETLNAQNSLPLVIRKGSDRQRNWGLLLMVLSLAGFAALVVSAKRSGDWDLNLIFLPLIGFSIGRKLTQRKEVQVDDLVRVKIHGLFGSKEWTEPLSSYSGLQIVESDLSSDSDSDSDDEHDRFRAKIVLEHARDPKKNLVLWKSGILEERGRKKARTQHAHLSQLLGFASRAEARPPFRSERSVPVADGTLSWREGRIPFLFWFGLFFGLFALTFVVVGIRMILSGKALSGLLLLPIPLVFTGIGFFLVAAYFDAKAVLTIRQGQVRIEGRLLWLKKVGHQFPVESLKEIHLQKKESNGKSSTCIRLQTETKAIDVGANLPLQEQEKLLSDLRRLLGFELTG